MNALVTGGGARVGRAIALELAAHGFSVAIHHRSGAEAAREVAAACGGFAVGADLSTVEGCASVVDAVKARWGRLHLLVNNASAFDPAPFEAITPTAWDAMLAVNLRAPFLLSQGLLPLLRPEGTVVHLCDIGGERPISGYAHYSVSKAGLAMLVRAMAVELAPEVRTVGVAPGQVAWPEGYSDAVRERIRKRIPMQRVGTPEDVARLVRFLALEAPYVNGEIVAVDGGLGARY